MCSVWLILDVSYSFSSGGSKTCSDRDVTVRHPKKTGRPTVCTGKFTLYGQKAEFILDVQNKQELNLITPNGERDVVALH
jgi:hypothetical protein